MDLRDVVHVDLPTGILLTSFPPPTGGQVEGAMFGQALMLLADPFVVQVISRTITRKLEEVSCQAKVRLGPPTSRPWAS